MNLWKQSAAVISRNPLILAVTALIILPGQILTAAMSRHVAGWMYGGLSGLAFLLGFYGLALLINAVTITLFIPAALQLISDTAAGRPADGWFGRGVRRLWWQPLVSNILLGSAFFAALLALCVILAAAEFLLAAGAAIDLLSEAMMLGAMIPFGIAAICVALVYGVLLLFSWAAIVEESSYNDALRQTFRLGFRHFFRVLGPAAVCAVSLLALYLLGMLLGPLLAGEPIRPESLTYGWPALLSSAWVVLPYAWLLVYVILLYRRARPPAPPETAAEIPIK